MMANSCPDPQPVQSQSEGTNRPVPVNKEAGLGRRGSGRGANIRRAHPAVHLSVSSPAPPGRPTIKQGLGQGPGYRVPNDRVSMPARSARYPCAPKITISSPTHTTTLFGRAQTHRNTQTRPCARTRPHPCRSANARTQGILTGVQIAAHKSFQLYDGPLAHSPQTPTPKSHFHKAMQKHCHPMH